MIGDGAVHAQLCIVGSPVHCGSAQLAALMHTLRRVRSRHMCWLAVKPVLSCYCAVAPQAVHCRALLDGLIPVG
jgi:hypothetical protein